MPNPAPVEAAEPKGGPSMRSLVAGLLPPDLGADNANDIARVNLEKVKSRSPSSPSQPIAPPKTLPPESPQLKALEAFANPKPGEPAPSVVKPGQQPEARTPEPAPEVKPEPLAPAPTPEPEVPEVVDGFTDDALLGALKDPAKPAAVPDTKVEPAAEPVIADDPEAPIEIPKTADGIQAALIKTSKLLREKQKKIKELEARGSIDTAAMASEPLLEKIKSLEAEKLQLANVAASVRIELLPEVQAKFIRPMAAAEGFINEIAKANDGVSAREIFNATQQTDLNKRHAAVRAACTDLHPSDALRVEQAVDAIHDLSSEFGQIKGNSAQIMANIEKQQQQVQIAQQAEMRLKLNQAHDKVFGDLRDDPVLSQFAAKDPEAKKILASILDKSKAAVADQARWQNPEALARAVQKSEAFEPVVKMYQGKLAEALGELKKARAQVLNLRGPSGLSTAVRQAQRVEASNAPAPQGVEAIVKGAFAGKLG